MEELEIKPWKIVLWCLVGIIALSVLAFTCNIFSIGAGHVEKSMQDAVINYNEYQDMYATCQQINDNLGVLKSTPDDDPQFKDFSKANRINAQKMQLNRWVNEYNAKSQHIDKKWWKSSTLPYRLATSDFCNY